jgi:hypothetical protein
MHVRKIMVTQISSDNFGFFSSCGRKNICEMHQLLLIGVVIAILSLISFGWFYRPPPTTVHIEANRNHGVLSCVHTLQSCTNDEDCQQKCEEAIDGRKMKCVSLTDKTVSNGVGDGRDVASRATSSRKYANNAANKVCQTEDTHIECDFQHGAIPIYTGSAASEAMYWDCLCSYPDYFGTTHCKDVNPGVCNGPEPKAAKKSFEWSTSSPVGPGPQNCQCPLGKKMITTKDNTPLCISENVDEWWYSENGTAT